MTYSRAEQTRNVLFFASISPPQPWACAFCLEDVAFQRERPGRGATKDSPVLHHIDGDHDNNDLANWTWAHNGCYVRHHMTGAIVSPEKREKISASLTGRVRGSLDKANISKGSQEFQRVTRDTCDDCGKVSTPQGIGTHQKWSGHQGKTRSLVQLG